MLKHSIIFLIVVTLVIAGETSPESVARKKKGHGVHSLFYKGGLWSLFTFVAIKIKIIVIVTVATTLMFFAGKVFMAIKYAKYLFKDCNRGEVIYQPPTHDVTHEYSAPPDHHAHGHDYPTSPSGPPNGYPPAYHESGPPKGYDRYGRSFDDWFVKDHYKIYLKYFVKQIDLTDYALNTMNVTDENCKRRLICEMNYEAQKSALLRYGFVLFSKKGLQKYRDKELQISKIEDCAKYYNLCI